MRRILTILFLCVVTITSSHAADITITSGNATIVIADNESDPVRIAAQSLARDFHKVMGFIPDITAVPSTSSEGTTDRVQIIIVNDDTSHSSSLSIGDGLDRFGETSFESHQIIASDGNI